MITINIHNPAVSSISARDSQEILNCLTFDHVWYRDKIRKDQDGNPIIKDSKVLTFKEKNISRKEAIISKGSEWYFHTGLLDRIRQYCKKRGIDVSLQYYYNKDNLPFYDDRMMVSDTIDLYDFQYDLVMKTAKAKRGIIKSATGTGKTIMQIAICDWFNESSILILAHTKSIVIQTHKKLLENGIDETQQIGAGSKFNGFHEPIVISTIQSFARIDPKLYEDYFDIIMVDESHHVNNVSYVYDRQRGKKSGQYAQVLEQIMAPIRLGFTATPPDKPADIFACEGLLGPIMGEMTLEEATELGVLAKPIVKIIKLTPNSEIRKLKHFPDIYREGVVQNFQRNTKVLNIAEAHVKKGETVLIFVTHLEHGERLWNLSEQRSILKDVTRYVRGVTDAESRELTRVAFHDKSVKCVIATTVWGEGIDVPSLDAIILATSEKSAKTTIQKVGRGLRKTDGKEKVIIYDFFDSSHNMLINHFGERFSLYCGLGFIK